MSLSAKLRFEVFKRDGFICRYCGRKTPQVILEVDHVIPSSKGGVDEIENLVTSCFDCNRGKGATLLTQVMLDKDIHLESILLAERERQLAEYNQIRLTVKQREDAEVEFLRNYFAEKFPGYEMYATREFPTPTVRSALKIMSYIDIVEDIDYAVFRTSIDSRGDYHNVAAVKYLIGILKRKFREAGYGSDATD